MRGNWLSMMFSAGLIALARPALSDEAAPAGIVMHAVALTTDAGTVHCALFGSEKGFPTEPKYALAEVTATPRDRRATCTFPSAKPGLYAVALWHDVNNNGKVDTNFLGIPTEPVAASNNAKGSFGPPRFGSAAFEYRPPGLAQNIRLN